MATIGHALFGLAVATVRGKDRRRWPSAAWWPGVLVLGAQLPDVGEWFLEVSGLTRNESHLLHSPLGAAGCVGSGLVLLWLFRVRAFGPHVCWLLAVLSHYVMDTQFLGREIRVWFQEAPPDAPIAAKSVNLSAEIWFYGFFVVEGLIVAALRRAAPLRRVRILAAMLLFNMMVVFVPRIVGLWLSVYLVTGLYALWSMRAWPEPKHFLNLVPVLPIGVLGGVELAGLYFERQGRYHEIQGDLSAALASYEYAAQLPTRTHKTILWWHIGRCHQQMKNLAEAERAYLECNAADTEWQWSYGVLARFYLDNRGTPYYRPGAAVELLKKALAPERPAYIRQDAQETAERYGLAAQVLPPAG